MSGSPYNVSGQHPISVSVAKPAASATGSGQNASSTYSSSASAAAKKAAAADEYNIFRMMGLPKFKPRLPSRNWLIFLSVTGTFTSLLLYDRYERRRIQRKWCDLVSHIPDQSLPVNTLPRKITIYLASPPGDGVRSAREHFYEYVKPVLVAGGLEWEVVEGRREGDVRYGTAERVRRRRRKMEGYVESEGERRSEEDMTEAERKADEKIRMQEAVEELRERVGTKDFDGPKGDLVIGRHTWKEYVRGLHEGWLGPLKEHVQVDKVEEDPSLLSMSEDEKVLDAQKDGHAHASIADAAVKAGTDIAENQLATGTDDASPTASHDTEPKPEEEKKEPPPKSKYKPEPYIATSAYASAQSPSSLPNEFDPAMPIPFPHILGFRHTPIRIYRYLTRRYIADEVGRRTAALVLASQIRSFATPTGDSVLDQDTPESTVRSVSSEACTELQNEESDWWKFGRRKDDDEDRERTFIDDVVVDERIGGRMRRFDLGADEEQRAQQFYAKPKKEQKDEGR